MLNIIDGYINFCNSNGHKYNKIYWNKEIEHAFINQVIRNNSGIVSMQIKQDAIQNTNFKVSFLNFKCNECGTIISIDNGGQNVIRFIRNGKVICIDVLNKNRKFNIKDVGFNHTLSKDISTLSCLDMIIKNIIE